MENKALKSQDLLVAMKLAVLENEDYSFESLGESLGGMPPSVVHNAIARAKSASLLSGKKQKRSKGNLKVNRRALAEFMIHGAKYAFPASASKLKVKGMPTADAIGVIDKELSAGGQMHWVWPSDDGEEGYACNPIHKLAPKAAKEDKKLYEMLALLDSQRVGDVRVREVGANAIKEKLGLA